MKARISGVAPKMMEINFLFSLMLAERLLKHCDNLSKTIQSTSMPAVEARRLSKLCVTVLQKIRGDEEFELFWSLVLKTQRELNVRDPVLPRKREQTSQYEDGSSDCASFSDPKSYYRTVYFQCVDTAITTIQDRFHQCDYAIYANLEEVLCKAYSKQDFSRELDEVCTFFSGDFNRSLLETQLQLLSCMEINSSALTICFKDIHHHFQALPQSEVMLLSEVASLFFLCQPLMLYQKEALLQ